MSAYCSKCNINWAQLYAQAAGDEEYYYCPKCLNDQHLEDVNSMTTYIMCPFTGNIIDVDTKEIMKPEAAIGIVEPVYQSYIKPDYQLIADRELKAILAYQESGRSEDYFKAFK